MDKYRKLIQSSRRHNFQGKGSKVRVSLNGVKAVFHNPHPERETNKGAIESVQEFLINAGVSNYDY